MFCVVYVRTYVCVCVCVCVARLTPWFNIIVYYHRFINGSILAAFYESTATSYRLFHICGFMTVIDTCMDSVLFQTYYIFGTNFDFVAI